MSAFGWSFPPGAEHDPRAPYNQTEEDDEDIEVEDGPDEYRCDCGKRMTGPGLCRDCRDDLLVYE